MLTRLDNAKLKLLIFSFPSGNGKIRIFKMKIKLIQYQCNFEIEFFRIMLLESDIFPDKILTFITFEERTH